MVTQQSQKAAVTEDTSTPFEIAHDNRAGLRLYKFPRFKQVQLRFDNVVPLSIQEQLHQGGWTYRDAEGVYTKQFGPDGQAAAIIQARRLFGELCQALVPQAEIAR